MKIFLKILLTIIILIGASVLAFNVYINVKYPNQVKNASMTYEQLTKLAKNGDNERVNILLLGVDNLSADDNKANMRTDTMMVFSIDPKTKTGFILSIPRDTKVNVEDYKGRINSAYSLGGIEFTIKAVKSLLNIPIHHFMEVDYQALSKTVDDIGGVEVNVPMDMIYDDPYAKPPLHIELKQGLQMLNGEKAMQFLRFRHGYADQDLGRIKSQQAFMNAVIKKVLSSESIKQIPNYLDTFYTYVKTDMSLTEVFQTASKFIDIKPYNIKRETLIGEAKLQHGVAYYIHDEEKMKEQINTLMQGKYFVEEDVQTAGVPEQQDKNSKEGVVKSENKSKGGQKESPKIPYVVVLNGVGSQGLAQRAKDLLYVNNIDVQDTSNADNFDYTQTYIYYKDDATLADNVQSILGTGTIVQENKAYFGKATDILIVIGTDFKK
ncbi:hypothetical protein HMPREF1142_1337 [Peptostreptococcaceae bacterium AS15]|nr:hypothetical protein HMPREF1142_1337 [Peptostreptococcaceae bacterium AS15]